MGLDRTMSKQHYINWECAWFTNSCWTWKIFLKNFCSSNKFFNQESFYRNLNSECFMKTQDLSSLACILSPQWLARAECVNPFKEDGPFQFTIVPTGSFTHSGCFPDSCRHLSFGSRISWFLMFIWFSIQWFFIHTTSLSSW